MSLYTTPLFSASLHLQRIDWMPSPPLVPDQTPLDLVHLDRMTFGDAGLQAEVLAMFIAQAEVLMPRLAQASDNRAALAHKLEGSAKAIGAHAVADAAEAVEDAPDDREAIRALQIALDIVCRAIGRRLSRC